MHAIFTITHVRIKNVKSASCVYDIVVFLESLKKKKSNFYILKCPYFAILKTPNFVLEVSYSRFMHPR